METPLILAAALKDSNSCSMLHQELLSLINPLENQMTENLLNLKENNNLEQVDLKIHAIISQALQEGKQSGNTTHLAQTINIIKKYLHDGIYQADIRLILISIRINQYLNIKTTDLLKGCETTPKDETMKMEKACKVIINTLSMIKFNLSISSDAPFHDAEILQKAKDGFAHNQIEDVYNFVGSMEYSSYNALRQPILSHLAKLLHDLNFEVFINYLKNLDSIFPIIIYLPNIYSTEEFIRMANKPELINKWVNFELIRQLIANNKSRVVSDTDTHAIYNILFRIKKTDFEFFKKTIRYFHHHSCNIKIFDTALGQLLPSCDSSEMLQIIEESLDINQYESNLQNREVLRNSFKKNSDNNSYLQFLQMIFNKWERFWNGIHQNKEFYTNDIIYTDYAFFIVAYHTQTTANHCLVQMILKLLEKISYIDSEWSCSESHQQTKFYLYMSELLLLSYAYRNKRITNPQILSCAKTIFNNPLITMRYNISNSVQKHCEEIIQNISWNHQS